MRLRLAVSDSNPWTAWETIFADAVSPFNPPMSSTVGDAGDAPGTVNASMRLARAVAPMTRTSARRAEMKARAGESGRCRARVANLASRD